mmetsp:Transcript_5901/g.11170  ORF Transcript_5901/g.11170 Transcript_5901/m.11170 type:complete len:81 (-) Transcript_5901:305-547(-)
MYKQLPRLKGILAKSSEHNEQEAEPFKRRFQYVRMWCRAVQRIAQAPRRELQELHQLRVSEMNAFSDATLSASQARTSIF